MEFLERNTWEGKIFSGGWVPGSGDEYDAVEPATGLMATKTRCYSASAT
jgi:benzaldehyde dehydrogenase (NAD)